LFVFDFSLSVNAALSAVDNDSNSVSVGSASARYNFAVGGAAGQGTQNFNSLGTSSQTGSWGTVTGSFAVAAQQNLNLSFATEASATVQQLVMNIGSNVDVTSSTNTTLRWLGIGGMHVYDVNGHEIALPSGAEMQLIGADSGHDYWNSSEPSPSSAPDSGLTVAMLLTSLGVIGLGSRRHERRIA
jgi:hypothetical protein